MKKGLLLISLFFFLFASNIVFAQRGSAREEVVDIRLGSPLPRSSDWGRSLDRLAAEWQRVTGNQVRVIVSHDGMQGSEDRMYSSLSSNSIQAALFTSAGMIRICPEVMTLSVPFMIKNETELDLVLREIKPVLDSRVDNNFVVVAWAKGGWIYLFSKEPVFTPDDLRRQRFGTDPQFKEINTAFRTMGFQLVEADITNLGTMLSSNRLNAIYTIPASVIPLGLHREVGNMLDMPVAPIMGAVVLNRVTWNKISPANQQAMIRVAQSIAAEFDNSMSRTEANAITTLGRTGFNLNKPNTVQDQMWRTELNSVMPSLIGTTFDRDLYQRINQILERARSGR